jgi:hypothetical protein
MDWEKPIIIRQVKPTKIIENDFQRFLINEKLKLFLNYFNCKQKKYFRNSMRPLLSVDKV